MFSRFILLCYLLLSSVSSLFAAECLDVFPSGWRQNTSANEQLINFPVNTSAAMLADGTTLPRGDNYYLFSGLANQGEIFIGASTASETTARLFFRASVAWVNVKINEHGNPEDLIIVVDSGLNISGDDTVINAIIYVKGTIGFSGTGTINGAAIAVGSAVPVNVNYDTSYITNADFNGMCDNTPVVPAQPLANYHFDECEYTGTGFEVIDQTGNYSATSHGGVNTFDAGKVERGAELVDEDHHFETSIPLPQDFSISTWFKKPTNNAGNRYFILGAMQSGGDLLYLDRNNSLRWGVYSASTGAQNGSYLFATLDNNWHHMALVYSSGQTQLYIDGTLEDTVNKVPTGTLKYIGTSFDDVNSSNPQAFRAPLDEFMVFDGALTSTEIIDIYTNQNAQNNYDGSNRDTVKCGILLEYRMDEVSWSGTVGEVIDETGNFNAQSKNGANTAQSTPAIVGNPGTCRYGTFDGVNDYVALPSSFENHQNSFTITAWIKPSNLDRGSRIFADDENNSQGYAFSLGDPGSGKLRFYSRGVNPISVDTLTSVIPVDTWTFVAAVHNSDTKTREIYVNGIVQTVTGGGVSNTYTGTWGVDTGIASIGGETNSGETANRFTGGIDEVRMYKGALTSAKIIDIQNETHPCDSYLDHFEIDVIDGQGLTCAADNITIKACADATCSTLNTETTDVLLSINGTPHKTVTVVGSTNTTINYTTVDVATLSLDQPYECANGDPNACDVTFADAGFIFSQTSAVNDAIDNQEAGTPFTGYLRAVESVDGVCTGIFNGDVTVKLSQKNVLPSGTEGLTFTVDDTHFNTQTLTKHGTYVDVELAFNSASEAILTNATYLDAGQIQLYASYNSADVNLVGSSNTFWVSPKNFVVIAKSGLNNLTESTSSGAITHKAGVDFSIEITAYNALASPTITQNYQPNYNDRFEFSAMRTGPISGSDGILNINGQSVTLGSDLTGFSNTLLSPSSFVNGKATVSANYSEVGLLQVQARDKDYGSDNIEIYSLSSNIGRFIPDHFDVNITSNSFENTCAIGATSTTDFTYIGQSFLYFNPPELLITAKNFSGVTTQNYTQTGYQKLIAADIERIFPVADSTIKGEDDLTKMVVLPYISEGDLTTPTPTPTSTSNSNAGEMIYTFNSSDSFTYTKDANSLVGAFTAVYDIVIDAIEDSEGVNASTALAFDMPLTNTVSPTDVNLRFGRWAIENTFGPETSSLPLPMAIQYWNGNDFVTNTFDTCTAFDATKLTIDNINISPATTTALGSGDFSGGLTQDIILSAPGAGNQGAVPVSYVIPAMPWLLYDWDWNGVDAKEYNKNPSATATFGRFRGNDRIIYQREVH